MAAAPEPKQPKPPRDHHYVPAWHLGGFTHGTEAKLRNRLIWRYCKQSDDYDAVPIGRAGMERDFYTVEHEDGTLDRTFETLIADAFDGPGHGLVGRLLRRDHLTDEQRAHLAAYLAFLHGRVPVAREDAFQMMSKVVTFQHYHSIKGLTREQFIAFARERGLDGTDEDLAAKQEEILNDLKSGKIFVGPQEAAATMVAAGAAVEALGPVFTGMRWTIMQAPIGFEFIIGDNPVVRYSESAVRGESRYGLGFATPDIEVHVPLTMNHSLLLTHQRMPVREWTCSPQAVNTINGLSWRWAQRYVFGSSRRVLEQLGSMFDDADARRQPGGGVQVTGVELD